MLATINPNVAGGNNAPDAPFGVEDPASARPRSDFAQGFHAWGFQSMHMVFALAGVVLFIVSIVYIVLFQYAQHAISIALGLLSVLDDVSAIRLFKARSPSLVFGIISDLAAAAIAGLYLGVNRYEFELFDDFSDDSFELDARTKNVINVGRAVFVMTILVGAFRILSAIATMALVCTTMKGVRRGGQPYY